MKEWLGCSTRPRPGTSARRVACPAVPPTPFIAPTSRIDDAFTAGTEKWAAITRLHTTPCRKHQVKLDDIAREQAVKINGLRRSAESQGMTASLFVSKLLTRVADTEDRNLRTLSVIVQRFLADSPELYLKAQMKVGLRYIMTRPQLREFIRRTGFEKWYQSTTLSMSAAGNLVFDVPRSVQPVRSQQHIAELFGATMTQVRVVIKRPVMHRKDEFYPMTEAQLVEVLIIARNAAYKLPSWQYANAPAAEAGPPALSTDAQKAFPTATRKRRDPSAP